MGQSSKKHFCNYFLENSRNNPRIFKNSHRKILLKCFRNSEFSKKTTVFRTLGWVLMGCPAVYYIGSNCCLGNFNFLEFFGISWDFF